MNEVLSDPYNELPIKSAKYAALCTELHLANKNITNLVDFNTFINLDTLWLNNNRLQSLDGLEDNFRIKSLYLHGNRFKSINPPGCLETFIVLSTLTLSGNLLNDFDGTVEQLRCLRNLQTLDLFDNPIAQEDNYRLRIIAELPTIQTLDKHKVTEEERVEAKRLKAKMEKLKDFQLTKTVRKALPTPEEIEEKERLDALHRDILYRFKHKVMETRIFLEPVCETFDCRKTGFIPESDFKSVLTQYGLYQILNEEEQRLIIDRYRQNGKVKAMGPGGTRTLSGIINYRKFCEAVLPAPLRVRPNLEYKMEPVPEVSLIGKDLAKYVKTIKKNEYEAELLAKTRAMIGSGSVSPSNSNNAASQSMMTSGTSKTSSSGGGGQVGGGNDDNGLRDFWLVAELNKIVANIETPGGKGRPPAESQVTRKDLLGVFRNMTRFKKIPAVGINNAVDKLFASVLGTTDKSEEDRIFSSIVRQSLGCTVYGKSPPPPIKNLFRVKWRDLTPEECEKLEQKYGEDGNQLLERLLRCGPKDDTSSLTAATIAVALDTTRIASSKSRKMVENPYKLPKEVIQTAGNRADVIVIPNLKLNEVKAREESSELSMDAWADTFSKTLGLKGDALDVALERKKRSLMAAAAEKSLKSSSLSLSSKLSTSTLNGNGKGDGEAGKKERKSALPAKGIVPPKGWSNATGTIVIG